MDEISDAGAAVLGASVDSESSHRAFARRYQLMYPLLADTQGKLSAAMGVLQKMGPVKVSSRVTFVIDEEGRVEKVFKRVSPGSHAKTVLAALS